MSPGNTTTTITHTFKESSTIAFLSYDTLLCTMTLWFTNGACYTFKGIDPQTIDEFTKAESPGRFFALYIKPRFLSYERVK